MFTPPPLSRKLSAAVRDAHSDSAQVRSSAARDLGISGQDNPALAVQSLEILLKDPDPNVRSESALSLGTLAQAHTLPMLEPLIDDDDERVRQCAIIALSQLEHPQVKPTLEKHFSDKTAKPDVRFQCLLGLCELDPLLGFQSCLTALTDSDIWIISEATLLLSDHLSPVPPESVHERIAPELARIKQETIQALRPLLEHTSGRVQLCAAIALGKLGIEQAQNTLVKVLRGLTKLDDSEDNAQLRVTAIETLGEVFSSDLTDFLQTLAWGWAPPLERDAALIVLARHGDQRSIKTLLDLLTSFWNTRRERGVVLCGRARLKDADTRLHTMLQQNKRSSPMSSLIVQALILIDTERARQSLETFVRDYDAEHGDPMAFSLARKALAK